jgi:hypothetical protein
MPDKQSRIAKLEVQRQASGFELIATVPFNITAKEFGTIHEGIVARVRDLTGCPCLSGVVRVVMDGDFSSVLRVNLETGQAV